jgi:S-adenosylhomocysteine hydrolase
MDKRAIQRLVGALPERGLDSTDAVRLFEEIAPSGRIDAKSARDLVAISELVAARFEASGKATWKKLTGIEVAAKAEKSASVGRPASVKKTSALRSEKAAVPAHLAERKGATPPAMIKVDPNAHGRLFTSRTFEKVLATPSSSTVRDIADALREVEKTTGDGDGHLAPRDLAGADPSIQAIMERVYKLNGRKLLSLDEIRAGLPGALVDLFNVSANRTAPGLAGWYRRMVTETLSQVASAYHREVVLGAKPPSEFALGWGFSKNARLPSLKKKIPEAFPPPNLDEIAGLYEEVLSSKLRPTEFYLVARATPEDIQALQAADPRFAAPGGKRQGVLPMLHARPDKEDYLRSLGEKFVAEVVKGSLSITLFCEKHEVDPVLLQRYREQRPDLFQEAVKATRKTDAAPARVVECAERMHTLLSIDPTLNKQEMIDRINEDPAYVETHGKLTYGIVDSFLAKYRELFPNFQSDAWIAVFVKELEALKAEKGSVSWNAAIAHLQSRYARGGSFSRLARVAKLKPGLFKTGGNAFSEKQEAQIGNEARAFLKKKPGSGQTALLAALQPKYPKLTIHVLNGILTRQGIDLGFHAKPGARKSLAARSLVDLMVKLSPPGTTVGEVGDLVNQALAERGMPPFVHGKSADDGQVSAHFHAMTSEIVAEYARAAKKGASQEEIWAAVKKDYPTIDGKKPAECMKAWAARPEDFRALEGFKTKNGKLLLTGLGQKPTKPRYLGGWDFARWLDTASAKEVKELARLEQLSRIPLHLELLDRVIERLDGNKPLKHDNLLWVSHLLADNVPMAYALQAAGANSKRTVIVGTPYGSNPVVAETLEDFGAKVEVPKLDPASYRAAVKKGLDEVVKKHEEYGGPIVVIDDGGLVSDLLHTDPAYASIRKEVKIVEQTSGGILMAEKHALETPIVAAARSKSKKAEAKFIGTTVASKLVHALERAGQDLSSSKVAIVGGGWIGQAVGEALRDRVCGLSIIETSKERRLECKDKGFSVSSSDKALDTADIVIGATGKTSIKLSRLLAAKDKKKQTLVSVSSKRVEIEMSELEKQAKKRTQLPKTSPYLALPTAEYDLGEKSFLVVGDGWPANFDGDVRATPTELIQLTLALLLLGAIQASRTLNKSKGENTIVALDEKDDDWLLERWAEYRVDHPEEPAVSNPDAWKKNLIATAARLSKSGAP